MPNTITLKALVNFSPVNRSMISTGDLHAKYESDSKRYLRGVQTIGATEEILDIGEITNVGLLVLMNRSTVNSVDVALIGGAAVITIPPGLFAVFSPGSDSIYLTSSADTADVEFLVFPERSTTA